MNHKTSATEISCGVVHKLWRTSILCGKRRKTRKKCLTRKFLRAGLNVSVELWGLSQQVRVRSFGNQGIACKLKGTTEAVPCFEIKT